VPEGIVGATVGCYPTSGLPPKYFIDEDEKASEDISRVIFGKNPGSDIS
jgi:hypothetical protein